MSYAIGGLALFIAAVVGLPVGRLLRARAARDYWIANTAAVVLAMAITAVGDAHGLPYLTAAGIGLGFGLLTGMKWGLGRVVGLHSSDRDA